MFANSFFQGVPSDKRSDMVETVENQLRAQLCQDGTWMADYKRLRVVVVKG